MNVKSIFTPVLFQLLSREADHAGWGSQFFRKNSSCEHQNALEGLIQHRQEPIPPHPSSSFRFSSRSGRGAQVMLMPLVQGHRFQNYLKLWPQIRIPWGCCETLHEPSTPKSPQLRPRNHSGKGHSRGSVGTLNFRKHRCEHSLPTTGAPYPQHPPQGHLTPLRCKMSAWPTCTHVTLLIISPFLSIGSILKSRESKRAATLLC